MRGTRSAQTRLNKALFFLSPFRSRFAHVECPPAERVGAEPLNLLERVSPEGGRLERVSRPMRRCPMATASCWRASYCSTSRTRRFPYLKRRRSRRSVPSERDDGGEHTGRARVLHSRRMERWGAQETSSTAIQRRGECTPLAYVSSAACYDVLTSLFPDFRGSAHTRLSAHELLCQQLLAVWRHATCCSAVISHRLGNTMQGMQARECGTTVPEERREG